MHLILATRGIQQQINVWKMFMQSQMFDWKRQPLLKDKKGNFKKDKNGNYMRGKEEYTRVQGALRPIQLWEYVFPQESLQEVLAMMDRHKNYDVMRPEMAKVAWILRKGMGAKKIPDMPDLKKKEMHEVTQKFIPTSGIASYMIGIREDPIQDYPNYGFYQEGL